jgi:acyl-CoA hydrolase
VAALVHAGDTLQFGLGKLQAAVMAALTSHRRLRIHPGMVSDGVLGLIEHQALDMSTAPITTGVALGSERLYQTLANPALARFAPVSHTHALVTLAALPRFTAINSAMEIDLLGRANVRTLGGRVVSGVGGLVDFMHGARASHGGRAIIGMTACAGRAKRSRIVPLLDVGQVDVSADDIDIVVTEHGVAALRPLRGDVRAQALIALAAPEHRTTLQAAWERMQAQTRVATARRPS